MGPLARSTDDCIEFFKLMATPGANKRDPFQSPSAFNQQMFDGVLANPAKVKVGIVTEIPFLPVSAAVKRAIAITRKALEDEGYEVVDYKIPGEDYDEAKGYLASMIS